MNNNFPFETLELQNYPTSDLIEAADMDCFGTAKEAGNRHDALLKKLHRQQKTIAKIEAELKMCESAIMAARRAKDKALAPKPYVWGQA